MPGRASLACLAFALGCGGHPDAAAPTQPPSITAPDGVTLSIVPVGGDAQQGDAGSELPIPLQVTVLAPGGVPVRGVRVEWNAREAGIVEPLGAVTDDRGVARAQWTLGDETGEYSIEASSGQATPAQFHARARTPLRAGDVRVLDIATYDGSGEVVHPDVVRVPRRWSLGQRFLAITPYRNGNSAYENPSIFTAGDASEWQEPPGASNPIARPSAGYLSDPDMVFEPDSRELWMYYRGVSADNSIYLTRSSDGITWREPTVLIRAPRHQIVSPSVVRLRANEWHMWSVDAGVQGCTATHTVVEHRTSADGVNWSRPREARLSTELPLDAWHIDVEWIEELGEYWALYNVKTPGTCATPALYLATSLDGENWTTHPTPLLERGAIAEFNDIVYRSSIEYYAPLDLVTVWYSGARYFGDNTWVWRAAVQRMSRAEMMRAVTRPASGASLLPRPGVPPLLRAP